ncbi:flagellar basal body rod protein FlgC [Ammoniphilus sp. YIM 78166]|uniref:flagellar basal body rod protein FlgC n=1 Tax=Ammoniphilus sp. YIM 78166 TaxID=1644106 RepID=UPI001070274F|nr:flagellar basal body rod protein FlgC [Ammoniphilus sp. YIM 78166]
MSMFTGMNISSSALTANRLRMDVISSNLANANTTRGKYVNGTWEPFRRKMVHVAPLNATPFDAVLHAAMGKSNPTPPSGVKVTKIIEDQTPFKRVYQPEHPDADNEGYVFLPNVDPLKEMVDLMATTKAYEANLTTFNATKSMMIKTLEIGR